MPCYVEHTTLLSLLSTWPTLTGFIVTQARRLLRRQPPGQQAIAGASKELELAPTGDIAFVWLFLFLCCKVTQHSTQSTRCTHQHSNHCSLSLSFSTCDQLSHYAAAGNAEDSKVTASSAKWKDPLTKSSAFIQLQELMEERIIYIDGAMGTSIQKHR